MISKEQNLKLAYLIEIYTHAISRFDISQNEYSHNEANMAYKKLKEFTDSITND